MHSTMKKFKKLQHQSGVSMVEALVSMLIFTVGALGLAALQLSSASVSADNEQRSLAVWKTQELIARIKSNPGLEADYVTAIDNNDPATGLGVDDATGVYSCPAVVPANCSLASATCTNAEIVAHDMWEVLCDENTGVVNAGAITNEVGEFDTRVYGSSGFNQLEVILRRLPEDIDATDVDGDLELLFEWVSQEAERSEGVADNISTNLCGIDYRNFDPKLDAYCVRFR